MIWLVLTMAPLASGTPRVAGVVKCAIGCEACVDAAVCTSCKRHYYMRDSVCYACLDNCVTCSSFSTCTACAEGFELDTGVCDKVSRTWFICAVVLGGLVLLGLGWIIASSYCGKKGVGGTEEPQYTLIDEDHKDDLADIKRTTIYKSTFRPQSGPRIY